jgi:hypothetical protein
VTTILAEGAGYHCGLSGKLHVSPTNAPDDYPPNVNEPARRVDDGYGTFRWAPADYNDTPGNEYLDWLHERGKTPTRPAVLRQPHRPPPPLGPAGGIPGEIREPPRGVADADL